MEYRGYDSVGVATLYQNDIETRKGVGKVAEVNEQLLLETMQGKMGIGHTRWATHGGVDAANAHPHSSTSNDIAIVHNGIIDNYQSLRQELMEEGFTFKSQTDSEVISNLLQKRWDETGDVKESMLKTVSELSGNYAFIALFRNGTIAAARYREPLILGLGGTSYFLSSDVLGFIDYTDDAIFLEDGEFVVITSSNSDFFNFEGASIHPRKTKIAHELFEVKKGEFSHFTLKEIFEQPSTILRAGNGDLQNAASVAKRIGESQNIYFTGSGTSYHSAMIGCYLLSKFAQIRVEPIISSEVGFIPHFLNKGSVLVAISQSGESADILNAASVAKRNGAEVVSIVNSMTSSLARESAVATSLNCGPEIGVAATKSFTSQLAVLYKLTDMICGGAIEPDFMQLSQAISKILSGSSRIRQIAEEFRYVSDIYVLGRGIHFPIALEGSLKIKELTYIHAEGLAGGELKHGPLALMHEGVAVIMINPDDSTYRDTLAGAHEIKARGGKIIGISNKLNEIYDRWIQIPSINEMLFPIVECVPLQLLAYYTAVERNANPDYPRNLAKCVTVK